ncbi:hypothetical protein [Salinibacterium sp. PAMC 21357]|uniref:hypothetical protein n=1 Tax=Salinibacterium sp. PAMC 21357 TaxID=1112215 RepID=UPI003079AEE6
MDGVVAIAFGDVEVLRFTFEHPDAVFDAVGPRHQHDAVGKGWHRRFGVRFD